MNAIKSFAISVVAIILVMVAMIFVGIGLVSGFAWEHARVGFFAGKMSPDWLSALLQKHFPKKKEET